MFHVSAACAGLRWSGSVARVRACVRARVAGVPSSLDSKSLQYSLYSVVCLLQRQSGTGAGRASG